MTTRLYHNRPIATGDRWIRDGLPAAKKIVVGRGDATLCFGKFKGQRVSGITDAGYLRWVLKNVRPLDKGARKIIGRRLDELRPKRRRRRP